MSGRPRSCTFEGCTDRTVARRLCRKHYQAAWKSDSLGSHPVESKVPRLKDRKVCPGEHRHDGSSTCYILHQCRCEVCTMAHARMTADRAKQKAYGRYSNGLVDVAPVREHMLLLGEFGIGYKRVAVLAGIGVTAARTVIWGRQEPGPRKGEMQKRIKSSTASAILGVRPSVESLAGGAFVPARGVHRRVQALVSRGWSQSKIGARVGIEPGNFASMMSREKVTAATYRTVCEVYEALWNVAPPEDTHPDKVAASRARRYARERRWAPPLAWDDIDLDPAPPVVDEFEAARWSDLVDHVDVELAISGVKVKLSPASMREAVQRMHSYRWSHSRIADHLRSTDKTVWRIYQELGLRSWTKEEIEAGTHLGRQGRRVAA